MDELIRAALLALTLTQPPPAPIPQPQPVLQQVKEDRWLGPDKFQHFAVSFAVTSFAFAAASAADQDTDVALTIAIPIGAAAGIGKEISDRRRGDIFSARDLVADALGIAAAWVLLREVR